MSRTIEPSVDERRKHERIPYDAEMEIGPPGQAYWVRGRDVSLRGLSFYTGVPPQIGDVIRVGICQEDDSGPFAVEATVRHVTKANDRWVVGVEFPEDIGDARFDLFAKPPKKR